MPNDGLKTPLMDSWNRIAQGRAADAIQLQGKALPCRVESVDGQIVTVSFEVSSLYTLPNVAVPIQTGVYDWVPVQQGDQGIVQPADAYMGGVSGLGGGTASLATPGNLSALVFTPVSNSAWTAPGGNPNVRVVQGPDGVLMQDIAGTAKISITEGNITMNAGGHSVVISSAGVVIDGKVFLTHMHTGVQAGGSNSGPVF
jgi:hypothetical protein